MSNVDKCNEVNTNLYQAAKLIDNFINLSPEFETGDEFKEQISIWAGETFTSMSQCVDWANNNNVLLFYEYQQMTLNWCPDV
jgi:hypothetical protein